jgi:two-component system phosphate regulon sensor histidine kinase PhoR
MSQNNLDKLAALIEQQHEPLLKSWRTLIRELPSAQHLDTPTLNDHIPLLLKELATALKASTDTVITDSFQDRSPPVHGSQRLEDGFDIAEVVAEYNILRGCIHDLAEEAGLQLQGQPFRVLNRVFDTAIGLAVESFAAESAADIQRRREEYLAFVAHDLRTPLNAISLAARVLELRLPSRDTSAESTEMLKTLRRNVVHLEELVGSVLEENANLNAPSGVKVERRMFELWPVAEAILQGLQPVAGATSTNLINDVPHGLRVYADASLLRRVLQNLVANAIKYTPCGDVTVGAREVPGQSTDVDCWISDNGCGIPVDMVEKVFDKGESDHEDDGTGLGLAIVKTFIEAHGGTVSVDSTEGVGSKFSFTLPGIRSE